MISLSPSDFIKNILNIQDNNISFPEENYFQIVKKRISLLKFLKDFLNLITVLVHIVTLKILLKMVQEFVKLDIFLTRITILNLSLLYKGIFVKIVKKLFHLPLILLVTILVYLIILNILSRLNFKKIFLLHLLLRDIIFPYLLYKELWIPAILILKLIENIYQKLFVLMNLNLLKILMALCLLFLGYLSNSVDEKV